MTKILLIGATILALAACDSQNERGKPDTVVLNNVNHADPTIVNEDDALKCDDRATFEVEHCK